MGKHYQGWVDDDMDWNTVSNRRRKGVRLEVQEKRQHSNDRKRMESHNNVWESHVEISHSSLEEVLYI